SQLVFVNGRYAPRLSYLRSLPEGVRVAPLAEMLRAEPETLEKHLTRYAQFEDDPFVALNTPFFQDGAYVEVPKGTVVGEPIHLRVVSTSRDVPSVAHPRNLIPAGAGSQAAVSDAEAGAAPACTSVELYRGILGGRSRGVFNGNIYVRKDAQKTVARQTNKNLLLSKEAFVDSTPGLEILADDVKCNHSSTIGQLDENAVFYLR